MEKYSFPLRNVLETSQANTILVSAPMDKYAQLSDCGFASVQSGLCSGETGPPVGLLLCLGPPAPAGHRCPGKLLMLAHRSRHLSTSGSLPTGCKTFPINKTATPWFPLDRSEQTGRPWDGLYLPRLLSQAHWPLSIGGFKVNAHRGSCTAWNM